MMAETTTAIRSTAPEAETDPLVALAEALGAGVTLGELAGWTEDEEAALYTVAHQFYGQGKYAEALKMFGLLTMFYPVTQRYHMGMGACLQMLDDIDGALPHYGMAATLDATDPEAFFRLAECQIRKGMENEAKDVLAYVIGVSKGEPRYDDLRERAGMFLEALERRAGKSGGKVETNQGELQ
jgi:type III secretion system low calcium response chaperone LcrH/SycD